MSCVLIVLEYEWWFAEGVKLRQSCPTWMEQNYPPIDAATLGAALAPSRSVFPAQTQGLPFHTMVLIVPTPYAWGERRVFLRAQFKRSVGLLPPGSSAVLVFVIGGTLPPGVPPLEADEHLAPHCADMDKNGGWDMDTEHSATTCKVLAGISLATATWRFHFLARVGDDAYFRLDAFLKRVAPVHLGAGENLALALWMSGGHTNAITSEWMGGPPTFPLDGHGPYMGGMGYIVSYNVSLAWATTAALTGLLDGAPEDLLTGAWLQPMGHVRFARVNSPCFHNVAVPVHAPKAFLPWTKSRHWGAAPCTGTSLLMHYMNKQLWESIDDKGLLACGSMNLMHG